MTINELNLVKANNTITLATAGKYLSEDIVINIDERKPAPLKDVIFIDYDGFVLYSYTAAEFAELTEFPANPTHVGLISQGWNWSLSDAKTFVSTYGGLILGQMYLTDDGKTRLYIHLDDVNDLEFYIKIKPSKSTGVTINWGDDSTTTTDSTSIKSYSHTYVSIGDYVVTLNVTDGTLTTAGTGLNGMFGNIDTNRKKLIKAEIGNGITSIGNYTFQLCTNLQTITIPQVVTTIGTCCFEGCCQLISIVIPINVSVINQATFRTNTSLKFIAYAHMTSIGTYVNYFNGVLEYCISEWVGDYQFQGCANLKKVIFHDLRNNALGPAAFFYCIQLQKLTIPATCTSVGASAFSTCYNLKEVHFLSTTPPTLLNTTAFANTTCTIYVPNDSVNDYKNESNWTTYADRMVGE